MHTALSGDHGRIVATQVVRPVRRTTACPIARIHLLGPMRATSYLGDDIFPRGKKARAVLAFLCLARGEKIPRDVLVPQVRIDFARNHTLACKFSQSLVPNVLVYLTTIRPRAAASTVT